MAEVSTVKVKAKATAFEYTADGRTVVGVKAGETFDANAEHVEGLVRAGLIEEPKGGASAADGKARGS